MKLIDYINSLAQTEREDFAEKCNTTIDYLRQVAYGNRKCREALAILIDRESGGAVKFDELRPDVDWGYVRGKADSHKGTRKAAA